MDDFVSRVRCVIQENELICSGEDVLVALSGGADSVALLYALRELTCELGFSLCAAHLNHCLRGEQADGDERFCVRLCEEMNIPLHIERRDIALLARQSSMTLEQAGRVARYELFDRLGVDKIAVAHHMDDQAESVLLHLARGSGLAGLCGMSYKRGNVVRPLLCARRGEIEAYLARIGAHYCTDATNFVADAARNKLRLTVIPYFEKELNARFTEALCRQAELLRLDEDYLNSVAAAELMNARTEAGYDRRKLSALSEPIKTRALIIAMKAAGASSDIERKHVTHAASLLDAETGKRLDFPHISAQVSYDEITFFERSEKNSIALAQPLCYNMCDVIACGEVILGDYTVKARIADVSEFGQDPFASYVDIDKLPQGAQLRWRREGDRLRPTEKSGSKKLKDYYIDKKLPRTQRDCPLVCAGSEVLCIVGRLVCSPCRVDGSARKVLVLTTHMA